MSRPQLAVIVPTFNEADNIEKLLKALREKISKDDVIVVVDDNSPDGTGELAEKLSKKQRNFFVIHRIDKGGRGSAVFEGFKFAKKFNPVYYIEMDADFSHKPDDIPRLVGTIVDKKRDLIIGSRYLRGSKIYNWPLKRKVFSKIANLYAKLLLGIPISDYTNGFRIYSQKAVDFLLDQKLVSRGYIVLSETAYKLKNANFTFGEIPIIFVNRKRGQSNTNFSEIKNAFVGIWKIRSYLD